jgi:hypothetical protein
MNADQRERLIAARVQGNAYSAGLAAACLIIFGFFSFRIPNVTDMGTLGDAMSTYNLRIGGVLMALLAILSRSGSLWVLLADAVVSALIGVVMILASGLMAYAWSSVGLNNMLYFLFGGMFIVEGFRNGRDWRALSSGAAVGVLAYAIPPAAEAEPSPRHVPEDSLASRLRRAETPAPAAPTPQPVPANPAPVPVAPPKPPVHQAEPPAAAETPPPPSGFLAAFADEDDPRGV